VTDRENWLRAIEFRGPQWIPCSMGFAPITWRTHRDDLERVVLAHPRLFPGFVPGSVDYDAEPPAYRRGTMFRDNWGCLWRNEIGGLEGIVVESPLADWSALESYRPPDPERFTERGQRDWEQVRVNFQAARAAGQLTVGDGERLFDRLYFLRGFENLMLDFALDDPRLPRLIEMLEQHEMWLVRRWLDIGVDAVAFHTDIGTQSALMISPSQFRRYLKPMFARLFLTCRQAGAHVLLSSDGCLLDIVDDLTECGVSMHDPQYRANGLDAIERAYKGRLCINLDLDRQMFAFCSPAGARNHVREAVDRLAAPEGGLMVSASIWDPMTPIGVIEALCEALEETCLRARPEAPA